MMHRTRGTGLDGGGGAILKSAVIVAGTMIFAIAASSGAFAQTTFREILVRAQARAAVADEASGRLFVAAYDTGEALEIDPVTGSAKASVAVGGGPSALALARDGAVLACVNRLANAVSLVSVRDMTLVATVPCGKSPADIVALPGGGFAVANSFSDSVTIIDVRHPASLVTIENVSGVPSAIAASGDSLAVAAHVPPALHIFRAGSRMPDVTVPLPSPPNAVAALEESRFVVATKTGLVLVDAGGVLVATVDAGECFDVAALEGRVAAVTSAGVAFFSESLALVETVSMGFAARSIALTKEGAVVCGPAAKRLAIAGEIQPSAPVAAATEPEKASVPEGEEEFVEPSSRPAASPVAPVEAAPASVPPANLPEVSGESTPEQQPSAAEMPLAQQAETPSSASALSVAPEQSVTPDHKAYERMPVVAPGARVPFVTKPSPTPLVRRPRWSLGDALGAGLDAASPEGGFKAPDWTHPWRDVTADSASFSKGRGSAEGNVRLKIEDTDFQADRFRYDEEAGNIHASGNVRLTQPTAFLTAEDVDYAYPIDMQQTQPSPLVPAQASDEQAMARKRLGLGKVVAQGIKVYEPERTLEADRLEYDFAQETGCIWNAKGRYGMLYYGAAQVRLLGPASASGDDIWVTTCDHDPPHYRIRIRHAEIQADQTFSGKGARFQLGSAKTPLYWPRWTYRGGEDPGLNVDFHSGRRAEIGAYINTGQRFRLTPEIELGTRLFPTTKGGVGLGFEGEYDFMDAPVSPFFRGEGSFQSLYTTKDRGYVHAYHRQELDEDTVLLAQVEQWSDRDFYKDFFEGHKDRSEPRTFVNVTHTRPGYIAEATVKRTGHGFVRETERLPELSFHALERPLFDHVYVSFDTIDGHVKRASDGPHATRSINIGRISYDWDVTEGINVAPFVELEGSWYSNDAPRWYASNQESRSAFRFAALAGITAQTRLHREYPGAFGFDAFKHIFLPSLTYSYRPEPTMSVEDTPRFDAFDNVYGRSRLESKIANIVLGRDSATGQVWQVASLTLYQGTDFWNEIRKSRDYEIELDLRPRSYWGWLAAGEWHDVADWSSLDQPFILPTAILRLYERIKGEQFDPETAYRFSVRYGNYSRFLTYAYYDDTPLNGRFSGRAGFAYTETQGRVFNREMLYGAGYRLGENWSLGFEHRYDFERGRLARQMYEIRRDLHCWEGAFQFTDRPSGWDVGVELSIKGLPGSRLSF